MHLSPSAVHQSPSGAVSGTPRSALDVDRALYLELRTRYYVEQSKSHADLRNGPVFGVPSPPSPSPSPSHQHAARARGRNYDSIGGFYRGGAVWEAALRSAEGVEEEDGIVGGALHDEPSRRWLLQRRQQQRQQRWEQWEQQQRQRWEAYYHEQLHEQLQQPSPRYLPQHQQQQGHLPQRAQGPQPPMLPQPIGLGGSPRHTRSTALQANASHVTVDVRLCSLQ